MSEHKSYVVLFLFTLSSIFLIFEGTASDVNSDVTFLTDSMIISE